jgi:uncharacterized protein
MPRRIIVAGGSGFIGRTLCRLLASADYEVVVLSRQARSEPTTSKNNITFVEWDGLNPGAWSDQVNGSWALINLVGENIAAGRWTQEKKHRILDSRVAAGQILTHAVRQSPVKPQVFIQASAVGYYGDRADAVLDESAAPGNGFLADVAQKWEAASDPVAAFGVRRAVIRLGIVFGPDGGILARLIPLFKIFAGAYPAKGRQWVSWIHILDAVSAIRFILENNVLNGTFNLTAPNPVTARQFCESLGAALHRPAFLSIPRLTLKLAMGELADELLLAGQRVLPSRLLDAGFTFQYPVIDQALKQIFPKE